MSLIRSSPIAMWLKPGVFCALPGQMYVQSSWRLMLGVGWQLSAYVNVPLGPWLAANSHSSEILIVVHFLLSDFSLAGCPAAIFWTVFAAFLTETRQTTENTSVTTSKKIGSSSYGISSCALEFSAHNLLPAPDFAVLSSQRPCKKWQIPHYKVLN